jgi:trimethylamine--corrinoid protein Co-methyltransferase
MSNLLVAMAGADYIHDAAGLMEADLTVSFEKLVVDNEILGMCSRVLEGIVVNDDTLATELMIRKGPGEDFIAEEHTVKHMRGEFFTPDIACRSKRRDGRNGTGARTNAKEIVSALRQTPPRKQLPRNVREEIIAKYPGIIGVADAASAVVQDRTY